MTTILDRRADPKAQPAHGPHAHDAEAVNRKATRDLYASRQKIYAKLARGRFRTVKWLVMAITLGLYYGLPWLRWNRGPDLPDQAVLLDMPHNRFFFFFLEIWPQEFYFVTGLLILAALLLFLLTSVAGRVWCGYTCPQTVWTDLMITLERFWQGDRNERIRLDKSPWGAAKIFRKAMTHVSWMLIGLATGGAMVFYFRDAPTLARELVTGSAPFVAYLFLGIFAATTYILGGIAREQVCTYMCPWPRIQGAMTDSHTLLVSYREERGEPRGPVRKGKDGTVDWSGRGDCIDCKACIAVCPAGIDIRDGSQLECIQCALCIDACDEIMDKIGRPRGLVAYDTIAKKEAKAKGEHETLQLVRARTLLYVGLLAIVGGIMLVAWLNRSVLDVTVQHDRTPPFVLMSDGSIRNGFNVKILNKLHETRDFAITVMGLEGAEVSLLGVEKGAPPVVKVATDDLRDVKVFVTLPRTLVEKLNAQPADFEFVVRDMTSSEEAKRRTNFQHPGQTNGAPR